MTRRPWIGFVCSLAVHTGLLTLLLAVVSREALPALMVDLRDGFGPAAAPIRSLMNEIRHARGASSPAAAPRSRPPRSETATVMPQPLPEPLLTAPPAAGSAPEPSPLSPSAPMPPQTVTSGPPGEPLLIPSAREPVEALPASVVDVRVVEPRAGDGRWSNGGEGGLRHEGAAGGGGVPAASPTALTHGSEGGRRGVGVSDPAVAAMTPGGGSGVGAEYGPYLTALRQHIQQSLRYPLRARRRGVSGTVSVEILILADGTIGNVTLVDSSTHSVLDEAALETIRSLPRMPLPPELPARPLKVRVPVVFEMRAP